MRNKVVNNFGSNIPIHYIESHHECHAMSAASQCSFDEALIAVIDHTGNLIGPQTSEFLEENRAEQTSYFLLRDGKLKLVARDHDDFSDAGYGRMYSDVTMYLGFKSYLEAGKTMGLAAFGDPEAFSQYHLYRSDDNDHMVTSMKDEDYSFINDTKEIREWFKHQGCELSEPRSKKDIFRPFDMNLARWIQEQLQISLKERISGLMKKHNVKNLCMSGGVAMNSVLNRYLEECLDINVFIPPSPGDSGIALGAAVACKAHIDGKIPVFDASPYLGPEYSENEIIKAIERKAVNMQIRRVDNVVEAAANAINNGEIIAWFQGRSEYGPRALGNRSILASPTNSWIKEILNNQIKLREWFRPYAPVVRIEDASEYFNIRNQVPFMMKTAMVSKKAHIEIPGCIHVDNSARLQTVNLKSNKLFHSLIGAFAKLSGTPVLLNTSFNLAGMPIVESPVDAIDCFSKSSGITSLFIGNWHIIKKG